MEARLPHRYETDDDYAHSKPVHVVWEITLACNLKCGHCGSRAGKKRPNELTTAECVDVIRQRARLGTRETPPVVPCAPIGHDVARNVLDDEIVAFHAEAWLEIERQTASRSRVPPDH